MRKKLVAAELALIGLASGRAARFCYFIPLPLEDEDPVVDGTPAAFGHCRPEQIADLLVT